MRLPQITIVAALTLFDSYSSHAIANDVYRIKFKYDSNVYYFAGPVRTGYPRDGDIYLEYSIKGFTDASTPPQRKRIPLDNIRSASFDWQKVTGTTTDNRLIEGVGQLCISEKDKALDNSECQTGQIIFTASSGPGTTISTADVQNIGKIDDNGQRSAALLAIEQEKHRIESEEERKKQAAIEHREWLKALKRNTEKFRKELEAGDETNCGMVVQTKPPIVKIQTMIGEYWIRIDQVFPANIECKFINKVYQPPQFW